MEEKEDPQIDQFFESNSADVRLLTRDPLKYFLGKF